MKPFVSLVFLIAAFGLRAEDVGRFSKDKIPDVQLLNQRGEHVSFYSDLVERHVVAIDTIFTSCTGVCPLMGHRFATLEQRLKQAHASGVNLISVSVDPETDTPARLREFAAKYHGGPAWTLLTGPKPEIERLLKALNFPVTNKDAHTTMLLIGNSTTGEWKRTNAFAPMDTLFNTILSIGK